MNVAVVTPHHDPKRSMFLDRLKVYMDRQTRKPDQWIIVDEPTNIKPDLTYRVRIGIERAIENGADVILIMEDDDWYDPQYIEIMVDGWKRMGKPPLFGIGYTIYCYIFGGRYWNSQHKGRASLMSTLITKEAALSFKYPHDTEVWLDMAMWRIAGGKTIEPNKAYSIGIKHGIGMCGGVGHNKGFSRYTSDPNHNELRKHIKDDLAWYLKLRQ